MANETDKVREMVFPGDELATAEEYSGRFGTYEDETGLIRANMVGKPVYDDKERVVYLEPLADPPNTIKKGDIVIGRVRDIRSSVAMIEVAAKVGVPRSISGDSDGVIHISKISKQYLDDFGRALKIGDMIRARVEKAQPQIELSTNGPDLGVISATCPSCLTPLEAVSNDRLECPSCERKVPKKIAKDYGQGNM